VAAVDAQRREVGILSIPRDLWVDIPGYGQGRINIVDFVGESRAGHGGGPALVSKVLQDNLGIQTQHWMRVRQEGLVHLVDAIGGITVTLDCPFTEKTPAPNVKGQYEYLMLPAGRSFLGGETAKKFVTYRYASSDFSRARRQQQVIWAIRDRALEVNLFPLIPQFASALADTFQTDLLVGDLVELALLGRDLGPERVHGHVLSRRSLRSALINGSAVLVVADPALIREEVEGLFTSQPIAELGRSATGRCGGATSAAAP
jgi:LCP family protein required for cell wall assembly